MKYVIIYIKGLLMGAADIIPGVSGGTIAFITGIYDELITSISNINPSLLILWKEEGFSAVWNKINGSFLLALGLGIGTAIVSLAKIMTYLLRFYPILVWSFFIGLILASCIYIAKQVSKWTIYAVILLIIGAALVVWISVIPPLSPNQSLVFLFFAASIAACAMILPGISGSFILVLLGAYATVLQAISEKNIKILAVVAGGVAIGLLSFTKILKYLFQKHPNLLIAFLTGLLIGSLWKLWPWKITPLVYVKGNGVENIKQISPTLSSLTAYLENQNISNPDSYKPYTEVNVLPQTYSILNNGIDPQLLPAIGMAFLGFTLLFVMEKLAENSNKI